MNRRSEQGFLLLEVLLATFLLAIALLVLIESLGRCIAAARSVQNYAVVEVLLANKSYEFRVERPKNLDNEEGTFADYPGFEWRRELESTAVEGLWKQTITVTWSERNQPSTDEVVEYRYLPDKQQ
jgi:type II secretion system protein I